MTSSHPAGKNSCSGVQCATAASGPIRWKTRCLWKRDGVCRYVAVLARARATSRAGSNGLRSILRIIMLGQHLGFHEQAWQSYWLPDNETGSGRDRRDWM